MEKGYADDRYRKPSLFIGSSSEGLHVSRYLQSELERTGECTVTRWDQGVFQASAYTMESLIEEAKRSDFAVLIASADDLLSSRGNTRLTARDNVIFELGLFIGVLGRERTYILTDRDQKLALPSDLSGLTWLPYRARSGVGQRPDVNDAVIGIAERIRALGALSSSENAVAVPGLPVDVRQLDLDVEINRICVSAEAQGWRVKTRSSTVLRLVNRAGRRFTMTIDGPAEARVEIRTFAAQLRAHGLRVSHSVRRPVRERAVRGG